MSSEAAAPALKLVPRTLRDSEFARGDAYRLYQGDSLALLEQFEPGTFDMVFADPPYFLSNGGFTCKSGKRAAVNKGGWDVSRGVEDDHAFTTAWLKACQRVLKPTGTIWVSGTQHVIFSVGFAMQKLGYKLLNTVTWYKPNASPQPGVPLLHALDARSSSGRSPKPAAKLQHTFNYAQA